jgi:predicted phosphohydrolase
MRIVATADLHYHQRWSEALRHLVAEVRREEPDCLIVAGDAGHPLSRFEQGLTLFSALKCRKVALAGNHDVWSGEQSSQVLWDHLLEEAAHRAGFAWLDRENVRLGSLGICGTIGWYDYSARDPDLVLQARDYYINKGMFNNDGNYVDWEQTDPGFAASVLTAFARRLDALCQDERVTQVLVATHIPPFEENLVRKPGDVAWNIRNAYTGNLTLGRRIVRCPKVTHVVSGHTHRGGRWQIETPHGMVESYVVGSDYGRPGYVVIDLPWITPV